MKTAEEIESEIKRLPQQELQKFRQWYENFDNEAWDKQIESDSSNGKLDALVQKALSDHKAGKSRKL